MIRRLTRIPTKLVIIGTLGFASLYAGFQLGAWMRRPACWQPGMSRLPGTFETCAADGTARPLLP